MTLPAVPVAQSPEDKFREYLASRSKAQRFTGQQRDLVRHVFAHHNHFDADLLIDELRAAGLRVSRATVYRTLNKLVDAGLLRRLDLGQRTYFEHDYGYPHHEHLVCERCNRIIEFQNPAVECSCARPVRAIAFKAVGTRSSSGAYAPTAIGPEGPIGDWI